MNTPLASTASAPVTPGWAPHPQQRNWRTPSSWRLGLQAFARDWRAGDLRLLFIAVMLAVAALTSVGFFADRLQTGLARDARQMLGGDAVVVSDKPTPPDFVQSAAQLQLQTAQMVVFPTMARATPEQGGAAKLVALKAVPTNYPLRGSLMVSTHSAANPATPTSSGDASVATSPAQIPSTLAADPALGVKSAAPAAGQVFADAAAMQALGVSLGDTILLGDARLTLAAQIVTEPDRGGGFVNFAPRVMMASQDLPATQLIQPASRINYRFAVAGNDAAVAQFVAQSERLLAPQGSSSNASNETSTSTEATEGSDQAESTDNPMRGIRVESLDTGRPEMARTLDRANHFLNLVAMLTALLCAVAVALATRNYAKSQLDTSAMLRVLGLNQRRILARYMVAFGTTGVLASLAGVLLGLAVHQGLVMVLKGVITTALPAPSAWPALLGLATGLLLLLAFGLPPLLQLAQVPPLAVLRRELGQIKPTAALAMLLAVAGFALLLALLGGDWILSSLVVGGFAAAVVLFAGISFGVLQLLKRSLPRIAKGQAPWQRALRLATQQVTSRPVLTALQTASLALGLLALTLLLLLRTDLIQSWQRATPADAPNRFVINIQPDQADSFQATLKAANVQRYDWYPMFRGRLTHVNDQPVRGDRGSDDRAKRLLEREFNLSHSAALPDLNIVSQGAWQPEELGAISVEEGLLKDLGLKLGDSLTFDVAGSPLTARITSVRKVDWATMRANFFAIFPRSQMEEVFPTYMAAYRAPATAGFDNQLVQTYPNVTNVDLSATLAQVQGVLSQVSRAVEFLFVFTLAAGLLVLVVSIHASRQERARDFAILRALGAQNRLLRGTVAMELAGTGLLAGVLSSLVAAAIAWGLARWVFEFTWGASPMILALGVVTGLVLSLVVGFWSLSRILRQSVVQSLRAS